jgi:prepilin-type N-terminal cleavage/methylation domain-containing protein/prepilin-type processing-associated H-X9-DG protein
VIFTHIAGFSRIPAPLNSICPDYPLGTTFAFIPGVNRATPNRRDHGFTMVEMLVVIAIIGILAALLLPALAGGKARAKRILCESQLQEIGIGFQSFCHDHNSRFPMQVAASDGGSLEYVQSGNLTNDLFYFGYRHFQTLASFLTTPNLLVCPADTRLPAISFAALQNSNVSYFVGVDADYNQPMSILAGDGNLAASTTIIQGTAGARLTWNRQQHEFKGNVLFADGHVEEWSDAGAVRLSGKTEIVLPTLGGSGRPASPSLAANQGGQPALAEPSTPAGASNRAAVQNRPAQNQPVAANRAASPMPAMEYSSTTRRSGLATPAPQIEPQDSNPVATVPPGTNAAAKVSTPGEDDSTMSPTDRKAATVMREAFATGYLMLVLLLLILAAYRLRRWLQDRARRRRRQLAANPAGNRVK